MRILLSILLLLATTAQAQRYVKSAATIAELIAMVPQDVSTNVFVSGYYAANDGGGGAFYWNSGSSASTNLGTVLKSTRSTSGRWQRILDGYGVNVKAFGAIGDGSSDDTRSIQDAFNYASNNVSKRVYFPFGTFLISTQIITSATGIAIVGESRQSTKIVWSGSATTNYMILFGDGSSNISSNASIGQLTLHGNFKTAGINARYAWDANINNLLFVGFTNRALLLDNCYNAKVLNCQWELMATNSICMALAGGSGQGFYGLNFRPGPFSGDQTAASMTGVNFDSAANGVGFFSCTFQPCTTGVNIPNNESQLSVTFDSCYWEECTNVFLLGTSGTNLLGGIGPITFRGCLFAYTGDGPISFGSVNQLIWENNSVGPNVLFGSGIKSLYTRGNYYNGSRVQSAATYVDEDTPGYRYKDGITEVVSAGVLQLISPNSGIVNLQRLTAGVYYGVRVSADSDGPIFEPTGTVVDQVRYYFTGSEGVKFSPGTVTLTSGASVAKIKTGTGSPESVVTATVGSLFLRTDGGVNTTLYVKESGAGNTGWVAK